MTDAGRLKEGSSPIRVISRKEDWAVSAGAAVLKATALILSKQISPNVCRRIDRIAMQTPPESNRRLCFRVVWGFNVFLSLTRRVNPEPVMPIKKRMAGA